MRKRSNGEKRLPLVEERASVRKRTVEKGRVRIRTVVDERTAWVRESLASEQVQVERVRIGREVRSMPKMRREGETLVIPVVDEVLVVERRLILKEEVRVRKKRSVEKIEEPVSLKTTRAIVERHMRGEGPRKTIHET